MSASKPIPHPSTPPWSPPLPPAAGEFDPALDPLRVGAGGDRAVPVSDDEAVRLIAAAPVPISDDEAARLIAAAPVAGDRFAVLSRRGGRPMSDEQIAEFLCQTNDLGRAELPPLPVARVAAVPPVAPAPVLGYANPAEPDHRYSDPRLLAELPVAFRVLRVAPWLLTALFILFAMISSLFR